MKQKFLYLKASNFLNQSNVYPTVRARSYSYTRKFGLTKISHEDLGLMVECTENQQMHHQGRPRSRIQEHSLEL